MTAYLYGRPPPVFDPPGDAIQTSPLIPGSARLEEVAHEAAASVTMLAPPGAVERRYVLALALQVLEPGGRLDVSAPKDKGGSRLAKELAAFGVTGEATSKAHHKRIEAVRPARLEGIDEAVAAGAPRRVSTPNGWERWTQPGVFAWDRLDAGTDILLNQILYQGSDMGLMGAGADLGCGIGDLAYWVLEEQPKVSSMRMIDLDRRAIDMARRNVTDPRARFEWADARNLSGEGDLNFIVMNPPFHDGGAEAKRLGVAFIKKAAEMLTIGGVLWMVANRHLPYEAELKTAFSRERLVTEDGGYKVFVAVK